MRRSPLLCATGTPLASSRVPRKRLPSARRGSPACELILWRCRIWTRVSQRAKMTNSITKTTPSRDKRLCPLSLLRHRLAGLYVLLQGLYPNAVLARHFLERKQQRAHGVERSQTCDAHFHRRPSDAITVALRARFHA